ncbi:extracellular solute-binding protein [Catelliglobosispora koreensis]|uniref:extracellular solute-binding protein n=1 Tax=Catelliglobosispora koreensis TaxID=129052 RepID=UPI00036B6EE8|nr:extracellular solute-binding protein [Catelliglobosispora koreensis]
MRHIRMRAAAVLAAVVAASAALAGCSSGSGEDDGVAKVTFWQQKFEDYQQAWFKKAVTDFNASQSKVKVELVVVPSDTWDQKLKAAQAAGTQPDVATTNYGRIVPGATEGQFAVLDDLMPASAFADIKDNVKGFVTVGGKHYGYPMLVEPSTVLYYRTDLATAAGLDPKSPPKTWAELLDWSRKLTTDKVKGMTIASNGIDLGWSSWGLQYNACGKLPIASDWSKAAANEACYKDLLDFYRTLYQEKLIPQQPKVGYPDAAPYGGGEVAMMANGSWAIGQLKNSFPQLIAKTAVAPFPSRDGDASKTTATLGGWTLTVDSKSKQPKAAGEFINWLLAGDAKLMSSFFKQSGYSKFTVRKSVDADLATDADATADPFMKIIAEKIVPQGKSEPNYPWDVSLAMGTAIESAMKGTATVDAALQTADKAINTVIEKQALAGKQPK